MLKEKNIVKITAGLCSLAFLLTACQGSVSSNDSQLGTDTSSECENVSEDENSVTKEVVFLNRIIGYVDKNDDDMGFTGLWHICEFDEMYDPNTLFAYEVSWHYTSDKETTVKLLQKEGLIFIQNDSDEKVLVAATMEQLGRIFLRDEKYEGQYLGADAVVRPDMEEVIMEARENGINVDATYTVEWFDENFENLVPFLGTDKNRVTMTVPVILPEEPTENK